VHLPLLLAAGTRGAELEEFSTKVRFDSVDVPRRRAP
jgi:hypothetical protein